MNKLLSFFKSARPITLIVVSIGIGILAKLIETKFSDIAMGLQLVTFALLIYGIIKFLNSKIKN